MKRALGRLLLVGWLGAIAFAAQAAAPEPAVIPGDAERVPLWTSLRVFEERAGQALEPEQAAGIAADAGETIDSASRTHGRGTVPHWALFSLRNPEPLDQIRMLAIEVTTQDDIRLFERTHAGAWRLVRSLADAATGRTDAGTRHPVWELRLPPGATTEFLLRIEGPAIVRFPVIAYQPAAFAERERMTHILMGMSVGVCVLIGVYITALRRYIDDASVPLFIFMLIGDLIGGLWLAGFLSELFPGVSARWLNQLGFSGYAVLIGCGNLHARASLNTANWAPAADRALLAFGIAWLCLAPWFSLAAPAESRTLLVWGAAIVAAGVMSVSLLATRRGIPFSGFIAAAWLAYLSVSGSFLLARAIDIPLLWASNSLALVQAMLTALLFGLAMSQRLMSQRDLLVAARQEALMQHEKVAASMRERSRLFAATAHDLRQPLVGVSLFADLLKSSTDPEERADRARKLEMALKEIDGHLIGIQQLAAVNEESHDPVLETVSLDEVLAPVIEEYRGRAEYKRITIRYVPPRLLVRTHVPYFQRIVRNLLSNAVRYTDRGDRILVGCRRSGGLRLVIADTGRGMSEDQVARAFDPFQRFDHGMSIPDGFGLGLFSAKSLAEALDMTIGVRSHQGRGTEFHISLPQCAVQGLPATEPG